MAEYSSPRAWLISIRSRKGAWVETVMTTDPSGFCCAMPFSVSRNARSWNGTSKQSSRMTSQSGKALATSPVGGAGFQIRFRIKHAGQGLHIELYPGQGQFQGIPVFSQNQGDRLPAVPDFLTRQNRLILVPEKVPMQPVSEPCSPNPSATQTPSGWQS